ncbi:MAG: hypothetical protein JO128_16080 [Alphaproteobacteria bacterium]|nr:hypothetical protein [Alphaproteobacteria bacterium]
MFPSGSGGQVYFEYNYLNQDQNWSGTSKAPAANNNDKKLTTSFYNIGGQYMFNREWGLMAKLPYADRTFTTTDDSGNPARFHTGQLGDLRIMGMYTGFSEDMSTGILFGSKLPTGSFRAPGLDRDTQVGTGSTDTLIGAYHLGFIDPDNVWSWFAQLVWDHPVLITDHYRPGDEINSAVGIVYNGFSIGDNVKVAPLFQLINSVRTHDSGANADPPDTGYVRYFLSPGVEVDVYDARVYADIEFPVYQHIYGNQLVAPVLYKIITGYSF